MRLDGRRPLLVHAVGTISVVEDDEQNKREGGQQRQRPFPGREHGGLSRRRQKAMV